MVASKSGEWGPNNGSDAALMAAEGMNAKTAEERPSVSTAASATCARIVEGHQSANTTANVIDAKTARQPSDPPAHMAALLTNAKNAKDSTAANAPDSSSVL